LQLVDGAIEGAIKRSFVASEPGGYERAVELLRRALDLEPDNPLNRRMLMRARRNLEGEGESDAP